MLYKLCNTQINEQTDNRKLKGSIFSCIVVQSVECQSTFQSNISPPSSELKNGPSLLIILSQNIEMFTDTAVAISSPTTIRLFISMNYINMLWKELFI
jgi:hypothetical protein